MASRTVVGSGFEVARTFVCKRVNLLEREVVATSVFSE
jgi:hypothetical protein